MGRDKLLLKYMGKSILQHSVELLSELPVYERILVTSEERTELPDLPPDIVSVINPQPEAGISASIQTGITAATGSSYMFLTADQPKLLLADILPLITAAGENPDKIVFPVIDSNPNSPTIFPESFRTELLNLTGDYGGRVVRDAHREFCLGIIPANPGNFSDVDNKEDYCGLF